MPVARSHPDWATNGCYILNKYPTQNPKKQTMAVKININGHNIEMMAYADPHSYYTILNVWPEEKLLGDKIEIALESGKKIAKGRVVTERIDINDRATDGQILYVRTFPETIIGWKQLYDLGLMEDNTHTGFVTDVSPVLIAGTDLPKNYQGRLRPDLVPDARRIIASWVRKGLIERCDSVCNAHIWLKPKPNGNIKIIFHYGELNNCLVEESPLPRVHCPEAIEAITLGKYYSVIKLFYGEWQIPLDTYTKYKTAFTFLGKKYVWNRLPERFQNSTKKLNEALRKVLDKLPENLSERVTSYIDIMLVSAETKEQCAKFTETIQRHLVENSFELHQTQSQECKPVVQFLGREVTEDGIRLGKKFIQKVKNFQSPRDAKQLLSFLRCLEDANQFTPGFGIFSKSLYKLIGKNFHWSCESEDALFRLINQVLLNEFVAVPGLAENEACSVQIFVKHGAWMARILNSAGKLYRFGSGVFKPLKMKDSFAIKELKAMKEVWERHKRVLQSRDVEWEVESPDIVHYKDDPDNVPSRLKLDFLKTQRCKIKIVQPGVRDPPCQWPQNL